MFSSLDLPAAQLANLAGLGYLHMTPIQAEAMPFALRGDDLIAQAKTGSGKTAAFGIPLLHKLAAAEAGTQALIICPTRELSIQVCNELRRLARYLGNVKIVALYGGQVLAVQKSALKHGAHVIVGTPGRIKDHLARGTLSLAHIRTLVLDEADRMLEMGFAADIHDIVSAIPPARQTMLFSATFPENILSLSGRYQRDPVRISIAEERIHPDIAQKFFLCAKAGKPAAVAALLSHFQPRSALVFCNTKAVAREVLQHLEDRGFSAAALHGDLEQRDREKILMRFKHRSCRVLVATDVAARGLDIEELSAVINFDIPGDPETYVHRIGRTGRAGKTGYAVTLHTPEQQHRVQALRDFQAADIPSETIESIADPKHGPLAAEWATLCIAAGRKRKIRAGDILGALTGEQGLEGRSVGKIDVLDYDAYVSVERDCAQKALARLSANRIKGEKYKVRLLQ